MSKSLHWKSDHHQNAEWAFAKKKLKHKDSGAKITKSKGWFTDSKYLDCSGSEHKVRHSYIKLKGEIYALGMLIGKGSTAKVKLAENETGQCFAVKIGATIDVDYHERDVLQDINRLKDEGLRTNKHGERKRYLVTEYLGVNLRSFQFTSNSQRLLVGLQLIETVHRLNKGQLSQKGKRYFHNDIKPRNIVINQEGLLNLVDFGGATESGQTRRYMTHKYAAPEVLNSKLKPSAQSDTYSMGKTLRDILPETSWLQHAARLMSARNIKHRPFKVVFIVAFLSEIYHSDDKGLHDALKNRNYGFTPRQARALSALLMASSPDNNLSKNSNLRIIEESPHIVTALDAAYRYIHSSYDGNNPLKSAHRRSQGVQFVRNILSANSMDLASIRQEMCRWSRGYGYLGHQSSVSNQSRALFISQSTIFSPGEEHKPFLEKNREERVIEREAIMSFNNF